MLNLFTADAARICTHLRFAAVLLLACTSLGGTRAFGQGTLGLLPDPVSGRELNDYIARLDLSPEQLALVEAVHGQYREDFKRLRDGDIEGFLSQIGGIMQSMQGGLPDTGRAKELIGAYQRAFAKIESADNRFFSELGAVLTDAQAEQFPRLRLLRERSRYQTQFMRAMAFVNRSVRADLSEMALELPLTDDERVALAEVLPVYEQALTRRLRDLHHALLEFMLKSVELYEQMNITAEMLANPEKAMETLEALRAGVDELSRPIIRHAAEIAELNLQTARRLIDLLPDDLDARFRERFHRLAYPEAIGPDGALEARLETAGRVRGLTPEQLESLVLLTSDFRAARDRMVRDMIRELDRFRSSRVLTDFDSEAAEQHRQTARPRQDYSAN